MEGYYLSLALMKVEEWLEGLLKIYQRNKVQLNKNKIKQTK